jgi:hypothetical protein
VRFTLKVSMTEKQLKEIQENIKNRVQDRFYAVIFTQQVQFVSSSSKLAGTNA